MAEKSKKPALTKANITVYSTPTCPFCVMAKNFLRDNGIAFKDLNVADDANARKQMIQKSGQMGVPVIDINGKILVGFDKDEIKKALKMK